MEGGSEATPWRDGGPAQNARASAEAALRPDLEIRFEHDLDPLKDGDALRRRSSALTAGAAKKRRRAAASFRLSWTRASASTGHPSNAPRARTGGRSHDACQAGPPNRLKGGAILGKRAGGPNAAQPVTQTVSNPYLRRATSDGKHIAEKPHKTQAFPAK